MNLRELEFGILRALRRAPPGTEYPLSGELNRLSLADLLQLLAARRQSGILRLFLPAADAEITVREGQVLTAAFGRLRERVAPYDFLTMETGRFRFDAVQVYPQNEVGVEVQELILEAARHRDGTERRFPRGGPDA